MVNIEVSLSHLVTFDTEVIAEALEWSGSSLVMVMDSYITVVRFGGFTGHLVNACAISFT